MTLGEWRAKTSHLPDDTRIMVKGYEWGFSDLEVLVVGSAHLNCHDDSYGGPHEELESPAEKEQIRKWADPPPQFVDGVLFVTRERKPYGAERGRHIL